MSTPPPRRRRRRPQHSPEDATENPRPRKKKSTGKSKKKSKQNIAILRGALFAAAGLTLVGGIFLMDWHDVGEAFGIDRSPKQLLKHMQYYQDEQIELINSFKDREQAKAALPQLNEIAIELKKILIEYYEWDRTEDWKKHGASSIEEARQTILDIKEKRMQHKARLKEELDRLKRESALGHYVSNLVGRAEIVAARYGKQYKLNRAKKGAYADGYSPVTAETKLTIGMEVQKIGPFDEWEDCVVKNVNENGTVRVSSFNKFMSEIMDSSGTFDKNIDRDRLRIPDE